MYFLFQLSSLNLLRRRYAKGVAKSEMLIQRYNHLRDREKNYFVTLKRNAPRLGSTRLISAHKARLADCSARVSVKQLIYLLKYCSYLVLIRFSCFYKLNLLRWADFVTWRISKCSNNTKLDSPKISGILLTVGLFFIHIPEIVVTRGSSKSISRQTTSDVR